MLNKSRQYLRLRATSCLALVVTVCAVVSAQSAQSTRANDPRLQFVEFVMKAYRAYERKDREALLSMCAVESPHCHEFKNIIDEQIALAADAKLELKRVLILKATVMDNRAQVRVLSNFLGVNANGHPSEAIPGEWDHTLHVIRADNGWKLWRFTDTSEAFAESYLKADTEDQRAELLQHLQPVTHGFTKGLLDHAQHLLESRGDAAGATSILQLAKRLSVEKKDIEGEAGAQVAMGDVYLNRGDYVRAADNYQKVLSLAEKFRSKEGIAAVSVKMGNLHYQQGNIGQAMDHYLKSVRLYEELGSTIEITYPLVNLGSAHFARGEFEQALEQYQKVNKIYERLFAKAGTAWLLNKIADVYAAQGKREVATATYAQALKAHEVLGNKSMQAYALTGLGRMRFLEGDYREALVLFGRAIVLAKSANSPEIIWKALNLLGQSHNALKDSALAQQSFSESIAIVETLRNQTVGSEHDQELAFEGLTAPYINMVELLVERGDLPGAFLYAERSKGRMLLDVLRNGRTDITQNLTAEELETERSLEARMNSFSLQIRHARSLARPDNVKIANAEARLRDARMEYDAYQTRIYASHPALRTQRGEPRPLTTIEVEQLVPDDETALLEYVVAPSKTYLFVFTKTKQTANESKLNLKVHTISIQATELAKQIKEFRQTVARNSPAFKETARALYELLLAPASKELAGKTTVCIVPANQLWELPFQALVSPNDKYMVEDHALFYVPSLSVLREIRNQRNAQRDGKLLLKAGTGATASDLALMAMGNPRLTALAVSRDKSADRSIALGELPEAELEVKTLGEIYGPSKSKILTGSAADEGVVKAEAAKYKVLHFATHGILDNDNPLYSRLLLASSDQANDGYLEAREIMKLRLRADLAVLSACQTGLGRVADGEGLIGMSWALFIAGTSTTVTSQWKVDSASTSKLMINFHRLLQGSGDGPRLSKAQALRQASLKLMAEPKYRHPFFWSGFVVVGEGL